MPEALVVALSPALDRYAWFERLTLGTVNRPHRVEIRPGGKALNASRVLVAEGVGVTALAPLDPSDWERWVTRSWAAGIKLIPTAAAEPTRVTMTCIDESTEMATEIYEPSIELSASGWSRLFEVATEMLMRDRNRPDGLVIAGSRPSDGDNHVAMLVATARQARVPTYLDGVGTAYALAAASRPTLLKVNLDEARRLLDEPLPIAPSEAAERLVALGPDLAIVTTGADGAVCHDGQDLHVVRAPMVPGPYPGGSGDAFLAGFVAAHLAGLDVDAALERARNAAETNATSPYAGWALGSSGA